MLQPNSFSDASAPVLPVQSNLLIGREPEVAAIQKMLRQTDTRLVTLTGPGGVGKTRLALRIAATLEEDFARIYVVNLAPVTEPKLVITALAQALNIKENSNYPIYNTLVERLNRQATLLVIDNFEQVLPVVPLLVELLQACPALKLLVTSRAALRLSLERQFLLEPLDLAASVTLFEQRVRAVRADFELTEANLGVVTEICRRLEGLPLAIELAASRTRLLPLQALLERLDNRLELLTGGARDLPAKQQTLRSTIEWSYNLLSPVEQQLFCRLAVFVGGASLQALEIVAKSNDYPEAAFLDIVQTLVEHNLVKQAELDSPAPRLFMLETIREFAAEKLEECGESSPIHAALANYFKDLFEKKAQAGIAESDARILALLDTERDNLRHSLNLAIEQSRVEIALELSSLCWQYWWARGFLNEGRNYLERSLSITAIAAPELRAKALNALGAIFRLQGAFGKAQDCFTESLGLYQQAGNQPGIAVTMRWLGMTFKEQEELTASRIYLQESLKLFRQLGDRNGTAGVMHPLGDLELAEGNFEQARRYQQESMGIFEEIGEQRGFAVCLANLGTIAFKEHKYLLALDYYRQSLQILETINDKNTIIVIALVGCLASKSGHKDFPDINHKFSEQAARLLGAAVALLADLNMAFCLIERQCFDQAVQVVRHHLGESVFEKLYSDGQRLTLEQAMVETVSFIDKITAEIAEISLAPAPEKPDYSLRPDGLTNREIQVLQLVAQGLTNREIAQNLVLSQLTVASYLHSIYGKLGVSSRAAATRYYLEKTLPAS